MDEKISQLTTYTTIQDIDILPIVDIGNLITKSTTWLTVKTTMNTFLATKFPDFSTGQTLTNKTLGTGTVLTSATVSLGSDATGDTYYNGGSGALTRRGIGTTGQVYTVVAGLPAWATPATIATGSYYTLGLLQGLTDAPTSGLVISSGIISVNTGVGANNIVKLDSSSKLPAIDGSQLINLPRIQIKTGILNTTTTVAHGFGIIPKLLIVTYTQSNNTGATSFSQTGTYDGTTMRWSGTTNGTGSSASSTGTGAVVSITTTDTTVHSLSVSWDATNVVFTCSNMSNFTYSLFG